MELPVFALEIDEEKENGAEVQAIALVDIPAIQKNFLAFKNNERLMFKVADEEQRIITGALMIPELPIYRRDDNGEYYVYFTKKTIMSIVKKYGRKEYWGKINLMHDPENVPDGVTMIESFVTDKTRGIVAPTAFSDLPEGTWFGSFYVENNELWSQIKEGKFQGFSVEGEFKYVPQPDKDEEVVKVIIESILA